MNNNPEHVGISSLIAEIYEAATGDGFTPLTARIAELTRSQSCVLVLQGLHDYHVEGAWFTGVDGEAASKYSTTYYQYDPTVVEHFERARENAYASEFNCEHPAYKENRFLNELCRPLGVGYFAGIYMPFAHDLVVRLTLQGAITRGNYDAKDLALLDTVMPHIRRGVEIHQRFRALNDAQNAVSKALDSAGTAMMLLDHSLSIVYRNQACENLLGHGLKIQDGHFHIRDSATSERFSELARKCLLILDGDARITPEAGHHLVLPRRDGLHSLACYLAPIRMPSADWYQPLPRNLVAVQLFDPQHESDLDASLLQNVLGLTETESRVAALLCGGNDATGIAESMNVSVHTARGHIKNIYAKMGVSKQSECVARAFSVLGPHLQRALTP